MMGNIFISKRMNFILAILIVMSGVIGVSIKTEASEFSDAQEIQMNVSVSGNVTQGYEEQQNYYKFTLQKAGTVTLSFTNPLQSNSDTYWEMYLYDSSYTEICSTDIKGNKSNTDSVGIGLDTGIYYVKITSPHYSEAPSLDRYSLQVNYTETDFWEKEFNDNYLTATNINLNTKYCGTTRKGYDYEQDYYKFNLDKAGKVNVNFTNPLQKNSEEYWVITIYNSTYELICEKNVFGNYSSTNLPTLGLAEGTYYIKVCSTHYYESSPDTYGIMVRYEATDYCEKERNEDFTDATDIVPGYDYCGSTWSGYDYELDYYKFNITNPGSYAVSIETPNLYDSEEYWEMYLYDGAYQKLAEVHICGNKTIHEIVKNLSVGTYYVKINSSSYHSEGTCVQDYKLRIGKSRSTGNILPPSSKDPNITPITNPNNPQNSNNGKTGKIPSDTVKKPGKVKKLSVQKKKKALKLKWKKVSKVTGYQVCYSTSSKFKKKSTKMTTSTTITLKKLKARKNYYVKVRAYVMKNGKRVYGTYSKVVKKKTK